SGRSGAAGGTAASAGTAGTGPSCDVGGLQVFPRSDTDQSWDDNDFSDVILSGYCPTLVDVTWPHEAGWENADPAEANHEATHFTLDSYSATGDLTGKQVNLTIELASDVRGAGATDGYYLVSLVSVSTYDRIVSGSGGTGGETTVTETGYAEAESATRPLLVVGDRVRLTFPLPNKTDEVDSYDPSRVIKVNVRVYNAFSSTALLEDEGGNEGEGGAAGETGTGGSGGSGGSSGTAGTGGTETGGTAGTGGAAGTSGTAGTGGSPGTPYDYRTSQFAIVDFNVTDAP
ncbi:MAG TPA: hypothetical protein VGK73_02300, partial [Polyangiaceae bacterium]